MKKNQTQDYAGLNDDDANKIILIIFTEFFIEGITSKYIYPNEDLCLFKDFPHKQLVIPSIFSLEEIECSCTLIWLMQNYKIIVEHSKTSFKFKVDFENFYQNFSIFQCMNNYTFLYESCRFDEKFNNCKKTSSARDKIDYGLFQIVFFLNWLKLVVEVYAKTFASAFGLITNILVLMVIKNTKGKSHSKNPFKNVMYEHIYFNSIFNCIFCLIQSFSLLNICIFPKSSFCSDIYKTVGAQYFKIIFTLFLGNSLRLCCNFSFISFSLSRFYISTSIKKSNFFNKFEKLNP